MRAAFTPTGIRKSSRKQSSYEGEVGAAEEGTSVSALVTRFLQTISGKTDEFRRLEEFGTRTLAELQAAGVRVRAADRLSRDATHERAVLR